MFTQSVRLLTASLVLTFAAASAQALPFGNRIHLHPHSASADGRITLTLYNSSENFREIVVEGKTYTILGHQTADITAPAGTVIYAGASIPLHKRGSELLTITSQANGTRVKLA